MNGTSIADYSRVGGILSGLPGPTIVAYGTHESGELGTGFAEPVVSTQLAMFAAILLIVRAVALELTSSSRLEGAPLTGRCFVDLAVLDRECGHGFKVAEWTKRKRHIPALPIAGVRSEVLESAIPFLDQADLQALLALPSPTTLRRLLLASARPMRNSAQSEAGNGFVSLETTIRFFPLWILTL